MIVMDNEYRQSMLTPSAQNMTMAAMVSNIRGFLSNV